MRYSLLILLISINAIASNQFTRKYDVVARDGKKAKTQKLELRELTSKDCFDGMNFQILNGSSDKLICDGDSPKLKLKAATVYHHLTIARDYFVKTLKHDSVKQLEKIKVRVDMDRTYHPIAYMGHESADKEFNNARTIPPGEGFPERGVAPWNTELWFMPMKKIHKSEFQMSGGPSGLKPILQGFRNQTHSQNLAQFLAIMVNQGDIIFSGAGDPSNLIRLGGTSLLLELLYRNDQFVSNFLTRNYFWLETALVPEIIYHEYAHIALSDKINLVDRDAVVEGLADYFATSIAKSPELGRHIKKYNVVNGKNARNNTNYSSNSESNDMANSDLVLSLIWNLRNIIPEEKMDDFVISMTTHLNKSRVIRKDLVEAILTSCREAKWCHSGHLNKVKKMLYSRNL